MSYTTRPLVIALVAALTASTAVAAQTAPDAETTGRIIVKFKDSFTKSSQLDAQRVGRLGLAKGLRLQHLRPMAFGANVVLLDQQVTIDQAEAIAAQIASDPEVEFAEPDRLRKPHLVPNDQL